MANQSPHWPAMKARYVEGVPTPEGGIAYPSTSDLAAEFGVSANRIRKVAARQKWTDLRNRFAAEREQARRQAVLEQDAHALEVFDRNCFSVCRAAIAKVATALQAQRVPPRDLVALSTALRNFQAIAHVAVGLPAGGEDEAGARDGAGDAPAVTLDWTRIVTEARKLNREADRVAKGAGSTRH